MTLETIPHLDIGIAILVGLLIGSFLNVVIHRLPLMMEQAWNAQCAQHQAQQHGNSVAPTAAQALSLSHPRSHCPHCGHTLRWYENIPVMSWLYLRGRCTQCQQRISWRYPMVELLTASLCGWCIAHWGFTATGWAWSGFCAALLALAWIDWDTTYLPDSITLPLTWAGLICAALGWSHLPLEHALWGAVSGYLSLWSIYWLFNLATGKEGMGYGDFKLLAALGAWLGWQALLPIILLSSLLGAGVGIAMKLRSRLREGGYIPFGPFLAGAGLLAMLFGHDTMVASLFYALGF